jgi:hypothetical protein
LSNSRTSGRSDETISADEEGSHKYLFQPILLSKFELFYDGHRWEFVFFDVCGQMPGM